MLPEIVLETLSFLNRSSLEACQLVNRSYLRTITKANPGLALRPMLELFVVSTVSDEVDFGASG
jgi:hypothetical protein